MKKYGKGIALALVFALVFSLFAGLGLYGGSSEAIASAAYEKGANEYLVLEIVPNAGMASFASTGFEAPSGKTLKIVTCTPTTLDGADFDKIQYADMFVINQGGNTSGNDSFLGSSGHDISWKVAYEIFKKVAGVKTEPAKYIIDSSIYTGATAESIGGKPFYAFLGCDGLDGYEGVQRSYSYTAITSTGYSNRTTKLFIMLETTNPATFYGLYFSGDHESCSIDPTTGYVYSYGYLGNKNEGTIRDMTREFKVFDPKMFMPFNAFRHSDNFDASAAEDLGFYASFNGDFSYASGKRGFYYDPDNWDNDTFDSNLTALRNSIITNNTHAYKFLIISPDKTTPKDGEYSLGSSTKYTTLVYKFFETMHADEANNGLINGADFDTYSMYRLAGDTSDLSAKYDCIYLDKGSDELANSYRSKLYGGANTFNIANSSYQFSGQSATHNQNDLTTQKKSQIDTFISLNKPLIKNSNLTKSDCGTGTTMSSLVDKTYTTTVSNNKYTSNLISDNGSLNMAAVINMIDALDYPAIELYSYPTPYESNIDFDFYSENGWQNYNTIEKLTLSDSKRYVADGNLTFGFNLTNATKDDVSLYIDENDDGYFTANEKKTGASKTEHTLTYKTDKTGGIYWKIEVKNGNKVVFETGVCAVKPSSGKQVINVLQIVPVDDGHWGASTPGNYCSPNLLMPMKSEIKAAKTKAKVTGASGTRGEITNYSAKLGNNGNTDNTRESLDRYFDGCLSVHMGGNSYDTITYTGTTWSKSEANRNVCLINNASLVYYFMEMQKDSSGNSYYDLNVLRLSTEEFEKRIASDSDDLIYQDESGQIYYRDPTSTKEEPVYVGCDLLMLGFCSRLGSMNNNAVNMIYNYIHNDKPAYIGGGAVIPNKNDNLSNRIKGELGFDIYQGTSDSIPFVHVSGNPGNGSLGESIKTNEGAIASYPYNIPSMVATSNVATQPYVLNLNKSTNDIGVFFASAGISTKGYEPYNQGYGSLGNVTSAYYLYKKGNITYSSVGHTEGQTFSQKGYTLTLPEAALLVNAIITSADPNPNDPPATKVTVNFVDKDTDAVIAGSSLDVNLVNGSHDKKEIEVTMPAKYGWDSIADPMTVKKEGAAIATAHIENAAVASGKLKFKFSDTAGFTGQYVITVKVSKPTYTVQLIYAGDGSILKTTNGELHYGETQTEMINVTIPVSGLTYDADSNEITSSISSKTAGSFDLFEASQTDDTIQFRIKDTGGFAGHYDIRLYFTGTYVPNTASYKIIRKTDSVNLDTLDAPAASGDLVYASKSQVTLNAVTYDKDLYDFVRVETDGKGSANTTGATNNGTVTCRLQDATDGFKNEYVVYVVLEAKSVPQPPIPTLKVNNPDKTEIRDEGTDSDGDGTKDGIIDTVPADPSSSPSPVYDPADPTTGIRYVKYTDYLYPDYETIRKADGTREEKVAESAYLYKNADGKYVMRVEFSINLGTDASGHPVNTEIDVQVKDPTDPLKRASLGLTVHQGTGHASDANKVTGNKITADGTTYFIEVPITNDYYVGIASQLNGISSSWFGMDSIKDGFGITIVAKPEGYPYGVKTDVNFVKRGLFRID